MPIYGRTLGWGILDTDEWVGDEILSSPMPARAVPRVQHRSESGFTKGTLAADAWGQSPPPPARARRPAAEAPTYQVSFPRMATAIHFPVDGINGNYPLSVTTESG